MRIEEVKSQPVDFAMDDDGLVFSRDGKELHRISKLPSNLDRHKLLEALAIANGFGNVAVVAERALAERIHCQAMYNIAISVIMSKL